MWNLLSAERLDRIRILKRLRYREWKAGKDVRLSGETENPEDLSDEVPAEDDDDRGPRRRTNLRRRPMKPRDADQNGGDDYRRVGGRPRGGMRGRGGRRRPPARDDRGSENEHEHEHEVDSEDDRRPVRGGGRRFVARRRFPRRR